MAPGDASASGLLRSLALCECSAVSAGLSSAGGAFPLVALSWTTPAPFPLSDLLVGVPTVC